MSIYSFLSTLVTVAGLVAIALVSDDSHTQGMAVGAIAGAFQPFGGLTPGSSSYRASGRRRRQTQSQWGSSTDVTEAIAD